ncbi:MAG: type II toxin-antitoxin system Phd/YefM family antitoxin [Desulfohalobium sp.]
MQVNMHEAKSRLSALGEKVSQGEKIIIAKAGKPYLELIAYQETRRERQPGRFKGQIEIAEDFDQTPEDLLVAFEGEDG